MHIELGEWVTIPTTYAGGAKRTKNRRKQSAISSFSSLDITDLDLVDALSGGFVDLTYGR